MNIRHTVLWGGGDWYTLPYEVYYSISRIKLTRHKDGRSPNVCASSIQLLVLNFTEQFLEGAFENGHEWVY